MNALSRRPRAAVIPQGNSTAAAHGPRLPETIEIDGKRRRLTKSESIRLIGNSVPKRMATLLAQANRVHALEQVARTVAA